MWVELRNTIRIHINRFWARLVIPSVQNSTCSTFVKLNVLEMVFKSLRVGQGLPIIPFFCSFDIPKPDFVQKHLENRKYANHKISEFKKDARRQILEIRLVKSASTSVVCWLVIKQIVKNLAILLDCLATLDPRAGVRCGGVGRWGGVGVLVKFSRSVSKLCTLE